MSFFDRAARFIDDVLLLPEDLREELEQAEAALARGKATTAEMQLRGVLAERPSLLRARQALALALEAQRRYPEAREVVRFSRHLDPDEPEVALLAARLALADDQPEEAIVEARDAARQLASAGGPAFAEACVLRARAERALGRPDRAGRELRKALAATPEDVALRLELAEAYAEAGQAPRAGRAVATLSAADLDPSPALRVGRLLLRLGDGRRARPFLERAAAVDGRPEALLALVDLDLEEGDLAAAEEWARRALVRHGGRPAMSRLAEVLHRAGRSEEAVEVLLAAADAADPSLLRRAARVVPLDAPLALAKVVAALELLAPEDPLGRALRAWLALDSDEPDVARERLGPEESVEPRWVLARARLAYRSGLSQLALELLARPGFAEHDRVRVERLRRDALRSRWRGAGGELDLAAAIDEVARFGDERGLEALARGARELRDELDRPLLLAILGEFNAGKSTLVNAFVGADVAPTGIVPTTATLNLLRGGAERRVRVVRRDGTTREGAYADLRALLEEADAETTPERAVDHIEIVLPSELLERVWVLDTPGSNAPVRDHERLAREALRRADAVLWVFDAGQAGKATEGKVLETIRASRRHVVAALNKVDRLAEGELPRVVASLTAELPDLHGRVVALSAKRALTARLREDEEALGASGFTALRELLESDVFGRSRHLKGRAVGGRLLEVLDRALAAEAEAVGAQGQREQRLTEAREALARAAAAMATTLDAALDELEGRQRAAFRSAAEEVLAFVRPRAHRFARHGADREDRAFLGELIEERLGRGVAVLEASLLGGIADLLEPARAALGVDSASVTRRVAAHVAPPIARFRGYQSGHLDGGALRQFFDRVLPRAELALEPLAEALDAARIPSAQELRPELEQALDALRADIAAELEARIEASREELGQVQEGTYEPLRALRTVVEELVDAPSTAAGAASSTAAGGGASTRPS